MSHLLLIYVSFVNDFLLRAASLRVACEETSPRMRCLICFSVAWWCCTDFSAGARRVAFVPPIPLQCRSSAMTAAHRVGHGLYEDCKFHSQKHQMSSTISCGARAGLHLPTTLFLCGGVSVHGCSIQQARSKSRQIRPCVVLLPQPSETTSTPPFSAATTTATTASTASIIFATTTTTTAAAVTTTTTTTTTAIASTFIPTPTPAMCLPFVRKQIAMQIPC